jgi:hypothetical protein
MNGAEEQRLAEGGDVVYVLENFGMHVSFSFSRYKLALVARSRQSLIVIQRHVHCVCVVQVCSSCPVLVHVNDKQAPESKRLLLILSRYMLSCRRAHSPI